MTDQLAAARAVVGFAFAESLRRRVFAVVLVLTVVFLGLYGLGAHFAFSEIESLGGDDLIDERTLTGSTIFGLAMFATLFLGAVLGTFLTIGLVRGDAESGLLQPLVVRPLGRPAMLIARFAGAAGATVGYVLGVYAIAALLTRVLGGYTPDDLLAPGLALAAAAAIVTAISTLASVFMASTAQGIAVFMVFGAGLVAGLLGQIGNALASPSLERIADVATWVLPFEALYQQALFQLTSETVGLTDVIVQLGPFGGAQQSDAGIWIWAVIYVAAVIGAAVFAFARRDL